MPAQSTASARTASSTRSSRRSIAPWARPRPHSVDLTAANPASGVGAAADFPGAPGRFPNWRIVPLYVRFGDESFRDYVDLTPADFYTPLRGPPVMPATPPPQP